MASENSDKLKALGKRLRRSPVDTVGVDVASTGTKVVRIKKADGELVLAAADILPAIKIPEPVEGQEGPTTLPPLELPKEMAGKFASLAATSRGSIIKLLNFPTQAGEEGLENRIVEGLGVENLEAYRIGYKLVSQGKESRALVVGIPDNDAGALVSLFPMGLPVPYSVEVSGLTAMTSFLHGPGVEHAEDAIGMIEFGAEVSYFAIFLNTVPVLIRKFDFGSGLILEKVQQSLGIDQATAEGILSDGSFDISQQISEVLDGFIKQVIVSRDFVERRENCRISKVYASGGVTASRDWLLELKSALGYDVELWNPFSILKVEEDAVPEHLVGQETRFSAAVGAALASMNPDD